MKERELREGEREGCRERKRGGETEREDKGERERDGGTMVKHGLLTRTVTWGL